jgi:peroxiredoxin
MGQVPHLNALHAKFDQKDLLVVGVTDEDEQLVRKTMDSQGMKFPVALVAKGLGEVYPIPGFPTSYVIDRDGTVLWKGHPGQLSEQHIEALLEETPPEE